MGKRKKRTINFDLRMEEKVKLDTETHRIERLIEYILDPLLNNTMCMSVEDSRIIEAFYDLDTERPTPKSFIPKRNVLEYWEDALMECSSITNAEHPIMGRPKSLYTVIHMMDIEFLKKFGDKNVWERTAR